MRICFEEAALVFDEPLALSVQDRIESGEQRCQTVGLVGDFLLILLAHTVQIAGGEVIRIISARRADRNERKRYDHG